MSVWAAEHGSTPVGSLEPFAQAAHELREYFLYPIPVGGDDGKKPLVKWRGRQHLPGADYIYDQIGKFPNANVGILCGPSKVTVVDIDDPGVASDPQRLEPYKQRFGDTPLINGTPSGGVHLYYKSSGERNANLRLHGLLVDVKGDGGMVVVPPSVCRSGDHAGKTYEFLTGSWMDLRRLPLLKSGALLFDTDEIHSKQPHSDARQHRHGDNERVTEGSRNNDLFSYLLREVRHCDCFEDLLDVAHTRNMGYDPPMVDSEVEKTARSAWEIEHNPEKDNWVGGPPKVVLNGGEHGDYSKLCHNADACLLYVTLKMNHAARAEPFAVSPKEMAAAGVILAFKKSHDRYRKALRFLLSNDLLEQVHCGKGRIKRDDKLVGDPHLFTFPSTPGPKSGPNITNTPSPPWGYGKD